MIFTYNEIFWTARSQAHCQQMVPHDVVGDHDADQGPDHGELSANTLPQNSGDDSQKDPCVVAHEVVEAAHESGSG